MQFNSYFFIFAFLPILLATFYLTAMLNKAYINKLLLIVASIFFYTYTDISTIKVLLLSVVVNYAFVRISEKREWKKSAVFFPALFNISLLLYYKYSNFAISQINQLFAQDFSLREIYLPLGISFFTFQQISYIVSVHRNEIDSNLPDYLCYILYFPKLLMGPLMEPADFYAQINNPDLKAFNLTTMDVKKEAV